MGVRLHVRSCWAARTEADAVYELEQSRILVGRGRGADVRLPHRAVSSRHATIELSGTRYALVDHGSTNGTRVQGARVVPGRPKPLRDGDRLEIGGFSILFRCGVAVTTPTSAERTASLARRLAREALDQPDDALRPLLTILNGPREGETVPLPDPPSRLLVGRGEECDVTLPDQDASREHAELEVSLGGVSIRDLGSKNGVLVAERAVDRRLLADRDEIRVGATVLRFEDPAAGALEALEQADDEAVEAPTWEDVAPSEPAPAGPALPEVGRDEASGEDAERAADGGEPQAQDTLLDAEAQPASQPASDEPRARAHVSLADMIIYVLASVVFALSVLGLVWLLRS